MSADEKVEVWEREYSRLTVQNQRSMQLLEQCRSENAKMQETNRLGLQLVENLKQQIAKYRDGSGRSPADDDGPAVSFEIGTAGDRDMDEVASWRSQYLTEKRTSEYLRAEIDDLQHEMDELRERKLEAEAVHEAWEEEVTAMFEKLEASNVNTDHLFDAVQRGLSRIDIKREDVLGRLGGAVNYQELYEETVASKLKLLESSSAEIQRLREVIKSQNTETFKHLMDRVARYHNLDGTDDTLFQLIVDAQLKHY